MSFSTLLTASFIGLSVAGYTLQDDYVSDGNFFDMFTFFTSADPTDGFVQYVDQSTASSAGYINSSSSNVYIGTDSVNVAGSGGRESVRITSTNSYDSGLVILDLEHMPGGVCGTWPAFWMVGPNWPASGEIDIIEGVNSQSTNDMTLHTSSGCSITNNGAFSGTIATDNCYVDATGQSDNAGCGIDTTDTQSYGSGFNSNNGGVYATNYESDAISIYFFPRGSIPADITSGSPDPTTWSEPLAQFQGGCDIDQYINNQQIVFDLTFCGSWAGAVWSSDATCSSKADTCDDFVQNNPSAFQDAYWSINSLKVYTDDGTSEDIASSSVVASTSSVPVFSSVSMSAVAQNSSSLIAPSTTSFAVSANPTAPIFSTGAPAASSTPALNITVPVPVGNATNGTLPTGSAAPSASATGVSSSSAVVLSSSVSAASVPSSPAETTPVTSSAAATSTEAATESYHHWSHTWEHKHYTPPPAAVRRHLRQHKRHAAGGF